VRARAIQRLIEDPLADFVLGSSLAAGSTILVGRKAHVDTGEAEVDIVVIPPDVSAEQVTVPPDEPAPAEPEETTIEE
jgi:hypothetical protein